MPAADPIRLVLLGPPASGKGTQGKRLASALDLSYLSTGALLRKEIAEGSALGREAEPILRRGGYLPDALMHSILGEWLTRQSGGWILDGFPRSLPQAEFLDRHLSGLGERLHAAVALEVPEEVLAQRVLNRVECPSCGWTGQKEQLGTGDICPACGQPASRRADDEAEHFRNRLVEYRKQTLPVLGYYRERGLLHPCDATAAPDEVAERLLRSLAVAQIAPS